MIRKHPVQAIARIGCCEPGIWSAAHRVVLTVGRSLPVYQDKRRYTAAPEASQKASPANEPSAAKRTYSACAALCFSIVRAARSIIGTTVLNIAARAVPDARTDRG